MSRLSLDVVIGRLGRIQSTSVPLSADAEPEERAAAWNKVKEGLAAAGESPCAVANKWRDYLLAVVLVAAEGRRTRSSPYVTIKPAEFCDLRFAGPHAQNATGDIIFYDVRISGSGLWRARRRAIALEDKSLSAIEFANLPLDQLTPHALPERSNSAPGMRAAPEPDPVPLVEAVHELRVIRDADLRVAISEMIDLLATGQLPKAHALIDGAPGTIDARWWWVGSIEYPNSSAAFNLIIGGEARLAHATEICLDRSAWERQKARIAAPKQQGGESFPRQDDPAWDKPVKLIDAIRLWSPALARCLDEVNWASPDNIRDIARRLEMYDHPTRVRARRNRAQGQCDHLDSDSIRESPGGRRDHATDRDLPEPLLGAWAQLLQEWDHWDDAERLVHAFELSGRLIIEKTKRGQRYILKYAPSATQAGLSADYKPIGHARHDGIGSYDFDLPNSLIRNPGGNWLAARICDAMDAEVERMRTAPFERGEYDMATAAAWAAELEKTFSAAQPFQLLRDR